ncbi:DUF6193 family natural product biosynthesis protein [Amycolatopsis sp. NPDC003676]
MDWSLYPDIAEASSFQIALQREFDRAGHDLEARLLSSPGWRDVAAVVHDEDRSVDVGMGSEERVFALQFWASGVQLAHGSTADLAAVAESIRIWLSGVPVRQLNAACPFAEFSPWSEACERGEGIEFTWQQHLANPWQAARLRALHSFLAAAARQPRLRALYPFTSHDNLSFRPAVRYTKAVGLWTEPLGDDRCRVYGPGRKEAGAADAAGSVELALAVLDAIAQE